MKEKRESRLLTTKRSKTYHLERTPSKTWCGRMKKDYNFKVIRSGVLGKPICDQCATTESRFFTENSEKAGFSSIYGR